VLLVQAAHRRSALPPWASTGLALLDGEPVACWGRSQRRVTLLALTPLDAEQRGAIQREAESMPIPGTTTRVAWR
jgi:hypothetical protein